MTKRSRSSDRHRKTETAAEGIPGALSDMQPDDGQSSTVPPPAADEIEKLRDRLLRLQAEFDNYRKRVERERAEQSRRSAERLIRRILPALDHFELGLKTAASPDDHAGPVLDGMRLILSELQATLEAEGLQPIDAQGRIFDPNLHEAVAVLPSPGHPDGTVIEQIRRGYRLGDLLLRPASVVVGRNDNDTASDGPVPPGDAAGDDQHG